MQISVSPTTLKYSDEEWQARTDLAAAHRLACMHGFNEGIFNHLTLTVPRRSDLLLSDSVRYALVGSNGLVVYGSRHRRR